MVSVGSIIAILVGCQLVAAAEENVCSSSIVGMMQSLPGKSCNDIYQTNKASRGESGLYWISTTKGVTLVYCDMEMECGGHKGGWMRIADLDTSRGDACPTGWAKITAPGGVDVCRSASDAGGCYSSYFPVNGTSYQRICGQMKGYQKGSTDGFQPFTKSINSFYVDGVSITIGSPRKHVWTYAVGQSDDGNYSTSTCPCADTPGPNPPPFVKDHYYCESGVTGVFNGAIYYTTDPLWDGNGCVGVNNNCCTSVGMPWFHRVFPSTAQEDVEVRICSNQPYSDEAALVELVQIFVQ